MTTYLTWRASGDHVADLPEKVSALRPVVARGPKAAATDAASWFCPHDEMSVGVGVLRADLLERKYAFARRYTVVFTRVVKETRRTS